MTKIRCGSPFCIHNYEGEFCNAKEINLSDVLTTVNGERLHYHCCNSYKEGEDAEMIREIVRKALEED